MTVPGVAITDMPAISTVSATHPGSTGPTSTSPVKRACDSCHRRKVKCIGGEGMKPCKNCLTASLSCTYNSVPQKKGPKGSRAKVLSELREHQRQSHLAPTANFGARTGSPTAAKTPGLLTIPLLEACVEYYFQNIYQTQPILHPERIQHAISFMDRSVETYCKLTSLCAFVLMQPLMVLGRGFPSKNESGASSNLQLAYLLLEETIKVRRNYDYIETPTLLSIYTSFFISQCYYCMEKQNAAWVYLREALTLAHILSMHEEDSYKGPDVIENSRKRRLFWLLFITERAYAFKRHRPLTLHATIHMPSSDDDPADSIPILGFIQLINLYKPFDEIFFGLLNRTIEGAGPSWLIQLQKRLSEALPAYLRGTEVQAVDLRMSQQWLKIMVWQLAISHGLVSSMATDNTLSFRYPIEISRELVELSNSFSQHAMEVHGIGLVEKLFDIACTLTDVMACVPQSNEFDAGPQDYLNRFVQLISTLRGGRSRYLPLIVNKVADVLPSHNLPSTISRNVQPNNSSSGPNVYNPSGGAPNQAGAHYDSPPTPHSAHPSNVNDMRTGAPGPPDGQYPTYPNHYDTAHTHVAPPQSPYPMYQPSMGYPDLGPHSHGPSQQSPISQGPVTAMYPSHVPQMAMPPRPGGYSEH